VTVAGEVLGLGADDPDPSVFGPFVKLASEDDTAM
jgi:hypothetical protein